MTTPPMHSRALNEAILKIGSQSALARLLGVSQPAVSGWHKRGTPLPAEHVLAVEAATGVSKHDLRPDIYPRDRGITHIDAPTPGSRYHFTGRGPAR